MNAHDIARLIDHTALGPEVNAMTVKRLCGEAKRFGFRTVCVPSCWVEQAKELLAGTDVGVGTTAGFPFGSNLTVVKAAEAAAAVRAGACEVDMVLNVGWVQDGRWDEVEGDIAETVRAARESGGWEGVIIKVIIETCLLTTDQKKQAARIVKAAGADFVKTSTGYAAEGAKAEDVALLRETVGPRFGIKASGGIRTLVELRSMAAAGADRIGTSAGAAIMEELAAGAE